MERLVPEHVNLHDATGSDTLELHLARYEFAAQHLFGQRALDIACGVGYGTRLLADRSTQVDELVGVDLEANAIEYAQQRYACQRVTFITSDAMSYGNAHRFDSIVSLETIEHLAEPDKFIEHLSTNLISSGGVLIASVPTTPSVDANPHHLQDFSECSFRRLFLRRGYREIAAFRQIQPFSAWKVATRSEARVKDLRRNLPAYYLRHPSSLVKRILTTLRYGFENHYLTVAWRAPS